MKTLSLPYVDRCYRQGQGVCTFQHALTLVVTLLLAGCSTVPLMSRTRTPVTTVDVVPAALNAGFEQAMTSAQQGDEAAAVRELEQLAQAYPQYAGPLLNLGILHLRANRLQEAEQAFLAALARNAGNALAYNQLGIVYRLQGRFEQAERAYQQALLSDPGYALAYLNLGVLYDLYLQRSQQALQAYRQYQALAITPRPEVAEWISELQRRLASGGGS